MYGQRDNGTLNINLGDKLDIVEQAVCQLWDANEGGFFFVVDGQFGSTGKGLISGFLAEACYEYIDMVVSNAGPNSGHTSYYGDEKIVLMQLPTSAVILYKIAEEDGLLPEVSVVLNAGAIIDVERLETEVHRYGVEVAVHKHAAVVTEEALAKEETLKKKIGSTGKGTGGAIASKVIRTGPVLGDVGLKRTDKIRTYDYSFRYGNRKILAEVSQGFSLGINQGFWPYTTSRECTVAQGLSDAGAHPSDYAGCAMVVRTYPIRVGGNSGPGYQDQKEITFEELGVEPETTTVTGKQRRIFTWSNTQFCEALRANRPDIVFLNFCNYLKEDEIYDFVHTKVYVNYLQVMGREPKLILLGFGPKNEHVEIWQPTPEDKGVPF